MPHEFWANAFASLTPTVLVGVLFWLAMRWIFRADRTERKVYAQIEAEERAKANQPAPVAKSVKTD
ncbi:hypothetical protein [Glaciihabitans sp. dw_435]|uniref:hypothetical protein n=1 Tax=Glaciihabitans sp. dw_435 TaxID=2720081 RepID=UPI001BD294AE|nr:hypothetical protein [Glaciihabitans sp. dw_435]